MMIIDLFTVGAQIVNFLILVFLLKKFLFNKIISIMDEREEQIANQLSSLEQRETEAAEELEKQRKIREKMESEWEDSIARMKKEVQSGKDALLKEARETVNQVEEDWKRAILVQRETFLKELRKQSFEQVCSVSKKVLADLANARLESQLIESFITQLEGLEEEKKQRFGGDTPNLTVKNNKKTVEIVTAFPLGQKEKSLLTEELKKLIQTDVQPVFKVNNGLICGIELKTEDKKISWNIENYLDVLENGLKEFLENSKGEIEPKKDVAQ